MSKPRKAGGRASSQPKPTTRSKAGAAKRTTAAGAPKAKAGGAGRTSSRNTSSRASAGARAPSQSYEARGASRRRNGVGGEQVEGRQAVRELLLAGRRKVREIWVLGDAEASPILEDILELAQGERVPVREVSRGKFYAEARCEAPQGVLAKAAELPEVSLEDLATTRPEGRPPFLVAVDGVTDPGNLGALLRSAECAGATGVLLPRHRAVHVTPTVTKAAAGAVEHLRFAIVGGLPTALQQLRQHGVWVVGLDGGGPTSLWDLPAADGPIALVLGAEGAGLSRLARQRCDEIVSIPLAGSLASLNVAAAAALACFEVARARARP
jgi:23S rRNA (guanosine2251-2'-O)-methyltransferase